MATATTTTKKTTAKKAAAPKAAAAKATAAKATTRTSKLPEIKLPEIKLPEIKMPEIKMPELKMPTFPSVDFSALDANKLAGLDDKLVGAVRDAAYVTIGFGVLAFQQAQVRRREMVRSIADRFGTSKTQVEELLTTIEGQLGKLDERFTALESKLDTTVAQLEDRLPEQAAAFVGQAHDFAKAARKQVRGLIRTAA